MTSDVLAKGTAKQLKLTDSINGSQLTLLQHDKAVFAAWAVLELTHFRVAVSSFERCINQCDAETFLRLVS